MQRFFRIYEINNACNVVNCQFWIPAIRMCAISIEREREKKKIKIPNEDYMINLK